jgi:energy-converting hydrogenase Eha subunit H
MKRLRWRMRVVMAFTALQILNQIERSLEIQLRAVRLLKAKIVKSTRRRGRQLIAIEKARELAAELGRRETES